VRITNCGGGRAARWSGSRNRSIRATAGRRPTTTMADTSSGAGRLLWRANRARHEASGTPDQWSGNVYNASDGKTYTGSFTLTGRNLAIKWLRSGLVCKTNLTRRLIATWVSRARQGERAGIVLPSGSIFRRCRSTGRACRSASCRARFARQGAAGSLAGVGIVVSVFRPAGGRIDRFL